MSPVHKRGPNLHLVLWKRLTTETPHRGNASKTAFEEFPFYYGKSLKTGKGWGISEYFWGVSQYLKLRCFLFFLRRFRFFLRRFRLKKKKFKLYLGEGFPLFFEAFPQNIWGVSVFLKNLFSWGVSFFFWGVSVFLKTLFSWGGFVFFEAFPQNIWVFLITLFSWGVSSFFFEAFPHIYEAFPFFKKI